MPQDDRKKLDTKSKRCIFVGYGTDVKGYRLYDMQRSRVIFSRDVLFDEKHFGFEENEKNKVEREQVVVRLRLNASLEIMRSLLTKIQIMKSKYQKQMRKKNLEQDNQQERDCYQIFMVFGSTTLNVSKIHLLSKKQ